MKKFPLNFLKILIFFFFGITLYSQTGGIKGSVKDSATGESIPFAILQIQNTKLGSNANVNGYFLMKNVPFGENTLIVSAVGYKRYIRKIKITSEEPVVINVSLAPQPIEIQAVTKTVERLKEIYQTNISVQSIGQQELKLVPVAVEKDLFKAIKIIPGISSTGDVTSQFYVRGGSGDQNLILLDNMMIYNPFHAFGLFSIFNSDAIKVSEVFTGGFGPEFGGRLSSVLNIITREGNKNRYSGKINLGTLSGQGLFEGPILEGSFFLSFRKSYFDKILKKFVNKDLPLSFYDLNGKLTYPLSDVGTLMVSTLVSNDEIKNTKITEPDYEWKNLALGITLQTFIENYLATVSFSGSSFEALADYKNQNKKRNASSKVNDFFFDTKVETRMDNNDMISCGISFIFPSVNYSITNNFGTYIEKRGDVRESNFWAKYRFSQIDNFTANIGFRLNFEYFPDKIDYAFEPRIGVKYQITPEIALKGSIGRYHQFMATTSNEDDVIPLFETWLPLDYPPSRCDEGIGGFDISPADNMNITIQGYYKRYKDLISYNLKKLSEYESDFTLGIARSYGMEINYKMQTQDFNCLLNYSLSWAEKKIGRLRYFPKYDRRHTINALVGANLPYGIELSLRYEISSGAPFSPVSSYFDRLFIDSLYSGNYEDEKGNPYGLLGDKNSARLPWYHRLDLSISKIFSFSENIKVNLSLDLINLYDRKNIFYFNKDTGEKTYQLPFLPTISMGVSL